MCEEKIDVGPEARLAKLQGALRDAAAAVDGLQQAGVEAARLRVDFRQVVAEDARARQVWPPAHNVALLADADHFVAGLRGVVRGEMAILPGKILVDDSDRIDLQRLVERPSCRRRARRNQFSSPFGGTAGERWGCLRRPARRAPLPSPGRGSAAQGLPRRRCAALLRETPADVLGFRQQLVEHARIEHLRDGERILAVHVRGLRRGRARSRRRGSQIQARRRGHSIHRRDAATRALDEAARVLRGEIVRRAEPAFEAVSVAAVQIEDDHGGRFYRS